jgi:integrase
MAAESTDPSNPQPRPRRPRKRGAGEGSIRQRTNGTWHGRLMIGRRADGKPDVRDVYGRTRQEVQRKLNDLRQRHQAGLLGAAEAERITVGAYLTRWLESVRTSLRPQTWRRYEQLARLHLIPALGRGKIRDLRPTAIQQLYEAKFKEQLAPRTIRHVHALLHTALEQAVRWGLAPRNPADAVNVPAVPRRELTPPTASQLVQLLDTAWAKGDRWAPLWTVYVYSGCRKAELLGLKWTDVDFEHGAISIRRTLIASPGGQPQFGEPKTNRSRRTITLPVDAMSALRVQQERQTEDRQAMGTDYLDFGLVFASHLGTPLMPRNVTRAFKSALAKAGLSAQVRIHDLRHAAATLMLAAGVRPKVASERLGHSNIGITLDTYSHMVQGLDQDAAQRIQQVIRPSGSTPRATDPPADPPDAPGKELS